MFLVVNGSFLSVFLFNLFSCNLSIEHFLNFKLLFHFDAFQGLLFHFEHSRLRSSVCLEVAASSSIWLPFSFCFYLFKFFVVLNQNFYLLVSCFNSCIKFNLGDFWRPIFRVCKLVYSWIDKFFKQNTCATERFNWTWCKSYMSQEFFVHFGLVCREKNLRNIISLSVKISGSFRLLTSILSI